MKSFAETCQILIYDAKLYQNSVMDDGIKIFCQEGVNMNLLFCPCCQSVCQSFHKNSHIISEFLHDGCYSENQNALVLDFRNDKPDMKKKGFKGSFICEKCEGEFSKYETYASQVLTKKSPHSKIHNSVARRKYVTRGLKFEKWIGLDFKKMQRFVLSNILRGIFVGHISVQKPATDLLLNAYKSDILDDWSTPIHISAVSDLQGFVTLPYLTIEPGYSSIVFWGAGLKFECILSLGSSTHIKTSDSIKLNVSGELVVSQRFKGDGILSDLIPHLKKFDQKHHSRIRRMFKDVF